MGFDTLKMSLQIVHRHICSISFRCRVKSPEDGAYKRLYHRKTLNYMGMRNSRNYSAYEGDGKTVANVINSINANTLFIHKYTPFGFVMPNGSQLVGSLMIFPHTIMSWHVTEAKNVTEESLILFKLLEPKIDILVFGYGNRRDYTPEVRENFTKCCRKLGLRFEALPTERAVGTFNFLAEERRLVAGALIPPKFVDPLRFERPKKLYLEEGDKIDEELGALDDGLPENKLLK